MGTVRACRSTQLLAKSGGLRTIPRGIGRRQESEKGMQTMQEFFCSVELVGDLERTGNFQGRRFVLEGHRGQLQQMISRDCSANLSKTEDGKPYGAGFWPLHARWQCPLHR